MRWILGMFVFIKVQGSDLEFPDENTFYWQCKLEKRVDELEERMEEHIKLRQTNWELKQRNLTLRRNIWYLDRIAGYCAYFAIGLLILRWLEREGGKNN